MCPRRVTKGLPLVPTYQHWEIAIVKLVICGFRIVGIVYGFQGRLDQDRP